MLQNVLERCLPCDQFLNGGFPKQRKKIFLRKIQFFKILIVVPSWLTSRNNKCDNMKPSEIWCFWLKVLSHSSAVSQTFLNIKDHKLMLPLLIIYKLHKKKIKNKTPNLLEQVLEKTHLWRNFRMRSTISRSESNTSCPKYFTSSSISWSCGSDNSKKQ